MAVCRAGAAANGIPLYKHIAALAGRPTDKFVLPVPSFNVSVCLPELFVFGEEKFVLVFAINTTILVLFSFQVINGGRYEGV